MVYALALAKRNIYINRQNSDNEQTVTRFPDKFKDGNLVYVKRYSPSIRDSKWEYRFCNIKFPTLCSAVLESYLNGEFRDISIWDIHLANPLGTENIPIKILGRKQRYY